MERSPVNTAFCRARTRDRAAHEGVPGAADRHCHRTSHADRCALLTTLGKQELLPPAGKAVRTGYGCGTKVFDDHPNFLRAILVETSSETDVSATPFA